MSSETTETTTTPPVNMTHQSVATFELARLAGSRVDWSEPPQPAHATTAMRPAPPYRLGRMPRVHVLSHVAPFLVPSRQCPEPGIAKPECRTVTGEKHPRSPLAMRLIPD